MCEDVLLLCQVNHCSALGVRVRVLTLNHFLRLLMSISARLKWFLLEEETEPSTLCDHIRACSEKNVLCETSAKYNSEVLCNSVRLRGCSVIWVSWLMRMWSEVAPTKSVVTQEFTNSCFSWDWGLKTVTICDQVWWKWPWPSCDATFSMFHMIYPHIFLMCILPMCTPRNHVQWCFQLLCQTVWCTKLIIIWSRKTVFGK
jgi:hypothetical protein